MSEAEFHEYWTHKHESVVKDWLIKHGCVKYVQVENAPHIGSPRLTH